MQGQLDLRNTTTFFMMSTFTDSIRRSFSFLFEGKERFGRLDRGIDTIIILNFTASALNHSQILGSTKSMLQIKSKRVQAVPEKYMQVFQ